MAFKLNNDIKRISIDTYDGDKVTIKLILIYDEAITVCN